MGLFSGIGKIVSSAIGGDGVVGKVLGGLGGLKSLPLFGEGSGLFDVFSTGLSYLGGREANSANAAMADKQMAFQKDMSNTAYQRAKLDLEKAGYNPMLAAFNGGASTPVGASAVMQDTITPALNSGRQSASVRSQLNLQSVQADNVKSQTLSNATQAQLNRDLAVKAKADAALAATSAAQVAQRTRLDKYDENRRSNESRAEDTWYGRNVRPFLPALSSGSNSAGSIANIFK